LGRRERMLQTWKEGVMAVRLRGVIELRREEAVVMEAGELSRPMTVWILAWVARSRASWPRPHPRKIKEEEGESGSVARRAWKDPPVTARPPPPCPSSKPLEAEVAAV
jgi:hypothetical protein